MDPEKRRRLRELDEKADRLGREAEEIFARVRARIEARRRADEERLERRRRLLRRLFPFRRSA